MDITRTTPCLINCDMGESFGDWEKGQDAAVMPFIDQASIACGFHASDPLNMEKTIKLAKQANVRIGAHPGYPDLPGFGRRKMELSADELRTCISYQIGALQGICRMHDAAVEYVKPHGALYNTMMKDVEVLKTVISAVKQTLPGCPLMVMATPKQPLIRQLAQEAGIELLFEAFSDRAYSDEGYLVDRKITGAVYHSLEQIIAQVTQLKQTGTVTTISGNKLSLDIDTICIHGDGEHAAAIARAVSNRAGD